MDAEEVSQAATRLAEVALPEVLASSGWLVATDSENRAIASGTATLLETGKDRFVATASHVVKRLREITRSFRLLTYSSPEHALSHANMFFRPTVFSIPSDSVVVVDKAEAIDVLIFRPPREMLEATGLRWFNVERGLRAVNFLRREQPDTSAPFLVLAVGYPNHARLELPEQRVQVASNFQCFGYLRQVIDAPLGGPASPQMIVELDLPTRDSFPSDTPEIMNAFADGIHRPSDVEPLGGYSGGPVVYLTPDEGHYLVGLTKEGSAAMGARMFVTPLDAVTRAIARTTTRGT